MKRAEWVKIRAKRDIGARQWLAFHVWKYREKKATWPQLAHKFVVVGQVWFDVAWRLGVLTEREQEFWYLWFCDRVRELESEPWFVGTET